MGMWVNALACELWRQWNSARRKWKSIALTVLKSCSLVAMLCLYSMATEGYSFPAIYGRKLPLRLTSTVHVLTDECHCNTEILSDLVDLMNKPSGSWSSSKVVRIGTMED